MKFFTKAIKSLMFTLLFVNSGVAQSDTLHLNFAPTQTVPNDSIEARIVKWGKSLKGQKVDIDVVAYYHKSDFKNLADARVDEMYLSLNRKVRDLITIKSQGSKKGKDSQRTRVDIIYRPAGTDPKALADTKKDDKKEEKKDKKDDKKDKKDEKKDKKDDSKVSSNTNSNQKNDSKTSSSNNQSDNSNKKSETDSKGNIIINSTPTGKTYNDTKEEVDTVYVNGVPTLKKKKKK